MKNLGLLFSSVFCFLGIFTTFVLTESSPQRFDLANYFTLIGIWILLVLLVIKRP